MVDRERVDVVLVTGASSGIGRAVALRFGTRHARVALVARRREGLEEVARERVQQALAREPRTYLDAAQERELLRIEQSGLRELA